MFLKECDLEHAWLHGMENQFILGKGEQGPGGERWRTVVEEMSKLWKQEI